MNQTIIDIYTLYGFEKLVNTDDYYVFTLGNGYFSNAEIVLINETDISNIKSELMDLGFSVREVRYKSVEEIHAQLFKGFFSADITKKKILRDYDKYCQRQSDRLMCNKYEYLNCDYISQDDSLGENIIDYIMHKMESDSAQLIILEASAGYGKTCTSYEVLKRYALDDVQQVPLMTELSRNRKAAIFRYVLLSEIDSKFSALSQKVVEYEIRNGNIPLIIDGFDELLSKSTNISSYENDDAFDETKGMLDTIADLITNGSKAKILITSRKSAIFTGEKFGDWIDSHDLGDKITLIELKAPQVNNWLEYEKVELLKQKNVDTEFISNPILLSLLRYKDTDYIANNSIEQIITEYINAVCHREKERQSLVLSIDEQKDILAKVAMYFCMLNISAEDDDFVRDIIQDIVKDKIAEYIQRYSDYSLTSAEEQPNEEEFLMKLLHNACLDRIYPGKNMIGFINEYSFGYFLGTAVIKGYLSLSKESPIDFKFLDLICTSFMSDEMIQKKALSAKIEDVLCCYSANKQLEICNKFFHKTKVAYENETINDVLFSKGFVFLGEHTFKNVVFMNCIFDNCVFENSSFYETQFYNCTFYSPNVDKIDFGNNTVVFWGCKGHKELAEKYTCELETSEDDVNYERIILEQFWKVGSDNPERRRAFTTIRKGIDSKKLQYIDAALELLIRKKILIKMNVCYELNLEKLADIRKILGR